MSFEDHLVDDGAHTGYSASFSAQKEDTDKCAICTSRFTSTMAAAVAKVPFRTPTLTRTKHTCRVCARFVCEYLGDPAGCTSMVMVHEYLWNRKLVGMRKKDGQQKGIKCSDKNCSQPCLCTMGWTCKECLAFMEGKDIGAELKDLEDQLDYAVEANLPFLDPSRRRWLDSINCEYADQVRNAASLGSQIDRVRNYFNGIQLPIWERPPAAERQFQQQYKHSAIKATETAIDFMAGSNIKMIYTTAKLAASGYSISQLFGDVVLSDEFKAAWGIALRQVRKATTAQFERTRENSTRASFFQQYAENLFLLSVPARFHF
jgi:hypothetical protein